MSFALGINFWHYLIVFVSDIFFNLFINFFPVFLNIAFFIYLHKYKFEKLLKFFKFRF